MILSHKLCSLLIFSLLMRTNHLVREFPDESQDEFMLSLCLLRSISQDCYPRGVMMLFARSVEVKQSGDQASLGSQTFDHPPVPAGSQMFKDEASAGSSLFDEVSFSVCMAFLCWNVLFGGLLRRETRLKHITEWTYWHYAPSSSWKFCRLLARVIFVMLLSVMVSIILCCLERSSQLPHLFLPGHEFQHT